MRIIAGQWRGRRIEAPAGGTTRPTSDRAREGLFSMLASRIGGFDGLKVADLFAGSGAAGLEALSRGAASCTFAETDRAALAVLKANVAALAASGRAEIRAQDGARLAGGPFDLVLLDPPYGSGLGEAALGHLLAGGALAPGALVSLETARTESVAAPGFALVADRHYGKARIRLFAVAEERPAGR
jgi:16S rRNA (guanine966-N2)-methyltransferase